MADSSADKPDKPKVEDRGGRLATYLAALATVIASMMPLTAFINGRYSVQVEREKFFTALRLDYLDRALDTTRDAAYRESVIRFLVETIEPSDPLYRWALNQKAVAEEIRRLEGKLASLDADLVAARANLTEEQKTRSLDKSEASSRERELRDQIGRVKRERQALESALRAAEEKVGRGTEREHDVFPKPAEASTVIIGSAHAGLRNGEFGQARLTISGRGFGSSPGHVYIVHNPGGAEQWEKLEVSLWNDIYIEASIEIPPGWEMGGPDIHIGITTSDSRLSRPTPITVGPMRF